MLQGRDSGRSTSVGQSRSVPCFLLRADVARSPIEAGHPLIPSLSPHAIRTSGVDRDSHPKRHDM